MNIQTIEENGRTVAVVTSDEPIIKDEASALDLIATCAYETGAHLAAIEKACLSEDFFKLSTGLCGAVLQKFVTYQFRVAIFGDFSGYTSKPLKDFIYESNQGRAVAFVATREEAVSRLLQGV